MLELKTVLAVWSNLFCNKIASVLERSKNNNEKKKIEFLGNNVTTEKNFEVLPYTLSHANKWQ